MKKPQLVIYDLIEQLEREHGTVPAFRVTRYLEAAFNELARKPLGPKPAKDQARKSTKAEASTIAGSIAGSGVPVCHQNQTPSELEPPQGQIRLNGLTESGAA